MARLLLALGGICICAGVWLRLPDTSEYPRPLRRQILGQEAPTEQDRLWFSVDGLRDSSPDLSAERTLSLGQVRGLIIAAAVASLTFPFSWHVTALIVVAVMTMVYFASMLLRLRLYQLALNGKGIIRISDERARAFPADLLPTYSVLVPAFREPAVCEQLVAHLRRLDYPADRLEIFLLLEEDDLETVDAARAAVGDAEDVQITLVPGRHPRTKPKALNYGLTLSRGSLVTIYDAEDRPDPLQLRKAAMAMSAAPPEVACVQAQLAFFNPTQNLITKWFTIEYRMWFTQLLPGLAQLDAPIPLGGTSNHFRRDILLQLNAWDPFNVTEDADLGVRMHRSGYRSGVLDSVTLEEANSDFINWVKQRSRWYKGYAQTLLVHLRHPIAVLREIGVTQLLLFILFVGGTPLLALLNPFFWALTSIWWLAHPSLMSSLFPTGVYFAGLICWIVGNFVMAYACLLSVRGPENRKLRGAALLMPVYWVMMSVAAIKAGLQLLSAPSYWEKTTHGLDTAGSIAGTVQSIK